MSKEKKIEPIEGIKTGQKNIMAGFWAMGPHALILSGILETLAERNL